MTLVLKNVTFDVLRSNFLSGSTSAALPYLSGVEGHMEPKVNWHVDVMHTSSVRTEYLLLVDESVDIRIGDLIVNILTIAEEVPYPSNLGSSESWRVVWSYEVTPGPLAQRRVVVNRYISSGPGPS